MSWIFITAGIGSRDFEGAADRLISQVQTLGIFDKCVTVNQSTLEKICPEIHDLVPSEDWNLGAYFGHYIWKPMLAEKAATGFWGNFNGVCWLDAGCEVIPSYFSRKSFLKLMAESERTGAVVFSTGAPELFYTKKEVFDEFPGHSSEDRSDQIAAGSWFFHGATGVGLVKEWSRIAVSNYKLVSSRLDPEIQSNEFVSPRYEQSILSLVCKSGPISPQRIRPPGSENNFRSFSRNFIFAFRWARNRTGNNSSPRIFRMLGIATLLITGKSPRLFQS